MAQSLKTFAKTMRKRAQSMDSLANDIVVIGASAAFKELIDVTPVDTSEAISNWQISLGAKTAGRRPPLFRGSRGSTRGASSAKALAEGAEELLRKQPGQVVYISNTAPHIVDLDRGSSSQFPGGFVPRALVVFRVAARNAVKRLWR